MSCLLHLALLAGVGYVAYQFGRRVGYEEGISQLRAGWHSGG